MKKSCFIFSTLFLALTTMPVDVFGGLPDNLLQPSSQEILDEAKRIEKEANRFTGTHDNALSFVPLSVNTNQLKNHVAISTAVENWKAKCAKVNTSEGATSSIASFKAKEVEKGSDTIFSCVVSECKDSFKYKVSKDESMCEMTKEYEKQLDKEKKDKEKQEKTAEKETKKQENTANQQRCSELKGSWVANTCYCGTKKQSLAEGAASCASGQAKEDKKNEQKKCDDATDAKWVVDRCKCNDDKKTWNGESCVIKTGKCKDSYFGIGKYNDQGVCEITDCSDKTNYKWNSKTKKCELKTTANIRNNKELKAADKAFLADIDKFDAAFDAFVEKYTKYCNEKIGYELKDGECKQKAQ